MKVELSENTEHPFHRAAKQVVRVICGLFGAVFGLEMAMQSQTSAELAASSASFAVDDARERIAMAQEELAQAKANLKASKEANAALAADEKAAKEAALTQPPPLETQGQKIARLLPGTWLGSKTGGTDGNTNCGEASFNDAFIRRQGNSFGIVTFNTDNTYRQWYVSGKVGAQSTSEGAWVIDGPNIILRPTEVRIGPLDATVNELPTVVESEDVILTISFDGANVYRQINIATGVTNRLVRCAE